MPSSFPFTACGLVYHPKMVVLSMVLLHLCTKDRHMVSVATKTFTVYMWIPYDVYMSWVPGQVYIFFFLQQCFTFPSFLYSVMLVFNSFYPQFCLVLRTVVSSSLIKENCLNEPTDVHSGLSCYLSVCDLEQCGSLVGCGQFPLRTHF